MAIHAEYQIATDTFNRANANPVGGNWTTTEAAALQIVSNAIEASAGSNTRNGAYYNAVTWPINQYSEMSFSTMASTQASGPGVRMSGSGGTTNGYYALVEGTSGSNTLYFQKIVAGSAANVTSLAGANVVIGDIVRIEVHGINVVINVNGVAKITTTDLSLASGKAGLFFYSSAASASGGGTSQYWAGGAWTNNGTTISNQVDSDSFPSQSFPGQIASDNFTRANENPLSDGGNWTSGFLPGTVQVLSNVCVPSVNNNVQSAMIWTGNQFPSDQYSEITISALTGAANFVGTMCRCSKDTASGALNSVLAYVQGPLGASAVLELYQFTGSTGTMLTSITTTINVGDVVRLTVTGNSATASVNGSVKLTASGTITVAVGNPGIWGVVTDTSSVSGSAVSLWAAGASGTQAVLNTKWLTAGENLFNVSSAAVWMPGPLKVVGEEFSVIYDKAVASSNQYSEFVQQGSGNAAIARIGAAVRVTPVIAGNFWQGYFFVNSQNGAYVIKLNSSGVEVGILQVDTAIVGTNGHTYRLSILEDTLTVFDNGVAVWQDWDPGTVITGGYAGIIGQAIQSTITTAATSTQYATSWAGGSFGPQGSNSLMLVGCGV